MVHVKDWRVSLCAQELHHPQNFSLNSCSHSGMSANNGSLRSIVVSSWFGLEFLVGLGNNGSSRSIFNILDTCTGWESIPLRSSLSRVSLSPHTIVVGEVDELEEDVGWLRSCLESVIEVEEWELDEELDDKPGTTIGTKFSVWHCIRIPFLMKCGFWLLIHS